MKLIIEGNDKKIKRLAKELKLRCRRNNLKLSLSGEKKEEVKDVDFINVADTAKLIKEVTDLEGLKKFESDERVTVIKVVEAKKAELEKEE